MADKKQLGMWFIIDVGVSETLKMVAGLMLTQGDYYDNSDIKEILDIAKSYETAPPLTLGDYNANDNYN